MLENFLRKSWKHSDEDLGFFLRSTKKIFNEFSRIFTMKLLKYWQSNSQVFFTEAHKKFPKKFLWKIYKDFGEFMKKFLCNSEKSEEVFGKFPESPQKYLDNVSVKFSG